jgi:hypothetical protein
MKSVKTKSFTTSSLTSSSWTTSSPLFIDVDEKVTTSGSIDDTSLATITTAGKVANSATSANSVGEANKIVARDSSGVMTVDTVTCSAHDTLIATAAGPQATSSVVGEATITGWSISTNSGSVPITESAGTFTIQKAGIYKVTGSTTFDATAGGQRTLSIRTTSATATDSVSLQLIFSAYATYQWQRNVCCIESFIVGDTVRLTATQNVANPLNISDSTIQIVRLS